MKKGTKFYLMALAILIVGGTDYYVQVIRVIPSKPGNGSTATDTTGTTTQTTTDTTGTTTGTASQSQCFGLGGTLTVGYQQSPPLILAGGANAKGFSAELLQSAFEGAGCKVEWKVVQSEPTGVDVYVGSPGTLGRFVDKHKWLRTKAYATLKLETVKRKTKKIDTPKIRISVESIWAALVKDVYPDAIVTPASSPQEAASDAIGKDTIDIGVVAASPAIQGDASHPAEPLDIEQFVAVSLDHQAILTRLNETLASITTADFDKIAQRYPGFSTLLKRP